MRVEIVTIGDELLLGFTVDTNAAFLARQLSEHGIEVVRHTTAADDPAGITAAVRDALDRTGAVITTGGLGPTADDLTRPAIAELFRRPLLLREEIVQELEERFRQLGHRGGMPAANRQQAFVPDGARVLRNGHGTAPGIWLEDERGWVVMLPGVPRELRGMVVDELLPLVRDRALAATGGKANSVLSRTLRTTGIGESKLADMLGDRARTVAGLQLAYIPSWAGTDLRLTARGMTRSQAETALDTAATLLLERAGGYVYGEGDADLAAVVLDLARAQRLRIATAESCTGGMLGARLTAIPGASDVYVGGIVAYAYSVKEAALGVQAEDLRAYGAVSEQVASQMARGVCERLGADLGVGITGVAGPSGGTPEKPVGTVWIGVRLRGQVRARGGRYVGDRDEIRRRSCQAALDMVRVALT